MHDFAMRHSIWCQSKKCVFVYMNHKRVQLAKVVKGIGQNPAVVVDHINSNPHDNRSINLRVCSDRLNSKNKRKRSDNTSGLIGVFWEKPLGMWRVRCKDKNGVRKSLGCYDDQMVAARVRDEFMNREHAGFSKLNFPIDFSSYSPWVP